jgi:DNA-binding CsgD family transcriptional regulator
MNLVGRDAQLATLSRLLAAVRAGSPQALVLVGEPGQGKTALLSHLADAASHAGSGVLRASGAEFESELPFSALSSVLTPTLRHLDELSAAQAKSVRSALDLTDGATPGLTVYAATLALVGVACRRRPTVIMVDDAQWVDRASLDVLLFCARRLHDECLGIMFATRDDGRFRDAGLRTLQVDGLATATASRLLSGLGVHYDVAGKIAERSEGNPLAMQEIARALSPDQRAGRDRLPEPLPIGRRLIDAYTPRLAALPDSTDLALQIAAIETGGEMAVVERVLESFGLTSADLDAALVAQLVRCDFGELRWVHPLARAAAHHRASPGRRREIHRAIADAVDQHAHPSRVAWHLSLSSPGPDEAVAARVEQVGAAALQRGALSAAADAFRSAARLSAHGATRIERWHRLAETLWWAGETLPTLRHVDEVMPQITDPEQRARFIMIAGQAAIWHTGPVRAAAQLERAAASIDGIPHLAALLLTHSAVAQLLAGDIGAARAMAARAHHLASGATNITACVASAAAAGVAELLGGDDVRSEALLDPLRSLLPPLLDTGVPGTETLAQLVALADVVVERWDHAEALLRQVMRIGDQRGLLGLFGFAASQLADLLWRSGRWAEAAAELNHLVSMTEATGQPIATHYASVHLALLEAGRGIAQSCHRHADDAIELADQLGMGALAVRGRSALGLLDLSVGQPAHAARHLDVVAATMTVGANRQPASLWWQADHIEALVASGRHDDAASSTDRLREQTGATAGRWTLGALRRAEALTGAPADADDHLTDALAHFSALGAPFEAARTLLLRGERRIEASRPTEGRRDIAEARSTFDALGARPWSDRATSALGRRPVQPATPTDALTPAELRIARAVSTGDSNRTTAERLHISVKTVDYHLQNIYRKLNVKNRTHLARVVATDS